MNQSQVKPECPNLELPSYKDLTDFGLYLDQVLGIVNDMLSDILSDPITKAMVNNWIKHKALPSPQKKKYYREHLAYLISLGCLKQVFTVQQISALFEIQKESYTLESSYNYFVTEFSNALNEAFSFTGQALPSVESKRTEQTILVRSMVLAAANRIYVDKSLAGRL